MSRQFCRRLHYSRRVRITLHCKRTILFPCSKEIESTAAAPLMWRRIDCIFAIGEEYRPLEKSVVGIVGVVGLGHLAIQFAKALGAEVYAFSRGISKKEQAPFVRRWPGSLPRLRTRTGSRNTRKSSISFWVALQASRISHWKIFADPYKINGSLWVRACHQRNQTLTVHPFNFASNGSSFGSSLLGSKAEATDMLQLAAEKGIRANDWRGPIYGEKLWWVID